MPMSTHNTLNSLHEESFKRLTEMQDQQSYTLQQLVQWQQQGVMALTLPQPTMKVFSGNPIDYCDFIRSFEQLIETKTVSSSAQLYYLIQYTSGSAQELIRCAKTRDIEKQEGF